MTVVKLYGSMAAAWLDAGGWRQDRLLLNRLSLTRPWTAEDDDYLRGHAGEHTRAKIAHLLKRSEGAVKRRLYDLGISIRTNEGFMSAMAVARMAGCEATAVYRLINNGTLKARRPQSENVRNRWEIDPRDVTTQILAQLRPRPKTSRPWTHEELEAVIRMREAGEKWSAVARAIGRQNNSSLNLRYEACFTRKPFWRAVWYTVRELGDRASIIDVERVMRPRGHRPSYARITRAAQTRPDRLRVDNGVISIITHYSRRVRPNWRGKVRIIPVTMDRELIGGNLAARE
jgi:hypothetical protein